MDKQPIKVKILEFHPSFIMLKFPMNNQLVKMSRRFFQKRVDLGYYEIENNNKIPPVI